MMTMIQNATLRTTKLCCSTFKLAEADSSDKTCQSAPNTASKPCFELARHWLSSCLTNHTRCTKYRSATPFHPSRLIEIAPLASASDDELHLRIAGEHSPEVHYITLSHCWGKSEFLKLTKTTSQRLRDGFSATDTLSKTFQDAITICREFGVKYLWIDALCIFQDSPEDWRCEAAQMGQVYENSLCNIAATWASNAEEGCFEDRDESLLRRCIIKSGWDNQKNGTWEIIAADFWDDRMNQAPLNKRGWVMQERWLSSRVLHYGEDQILWECSELDACETYPSGLPKSLHNAVSGFKLDPELIALRDFQQDGCTESVVDLSHRSIWSSLVNRYSVTSLTKKEDKLVAISGIAKRMQSLLDDEYLAGLWRKDLPYQLLWSVITNGQARFLAPTRPRPYRAPSWSWASVDEAVSVEGGRCDGIMITILDAVVTPVGADSTGQIKDGFIRLNGRIFPAELVQCSAQLPRYMTVRVDSEMFETTCYLDVKPEALGGLSAYLLPIRSYDYKNTPWVAGLILQAAPKGNGTYERIGYCTVHGERSCSALHKSQAYKDKSLYENGNGETIVLI